MTAYLKLYLLMVPIFLVVDLIWLGLVARGFYRRHLGHILSPRVNWPAAIVFYLTFVAGILYFAVAPGLAAGAWWLAVQNGLLFGLVTYVTYDLTNMATLPDWPLGVALVDILWGMSLCAVVAGLSWPIGRHLLAV